MNNVGNFLLLRDWTFYMPCTENYFHPILKKVSQYIKSSADVLFFTVARFFYLLFCTVFAIYRQIIFTLLLYLFILIKSMIKVGKFICSANMLFAPPTEKMVQITHHIAWQIAHSCGIFSPYYVME